MESKDRRDEILSYLNEMAHPIKGSELAKKFGVSRQVIVQDIALIRAKGISVVATPSGYMIQAVAPTGELKTICCQHGQTVEELQLELELMISYGAKVIDVVVEHPVYGEIRAVLNINCLMDLKHFMKKLQSKDSKPLSLLTEGVHYHTIEVQNEQVYQDIVKTLKDYKYVVE